ncbi:MAG: translation initiation factor IF-2 subunit gamma, partial [Candidatus Pacearchaeota archaeon]|nr:translation initiation factor IF-2 subunit gamma [Candidatus Pacearchaeota archaeon]
TVTRIKGDEIELTLKIPIVPFKSDRVGIARNYQGHWRLIGWGELL